MSPQSRVNFATFIKALVITLASFLLVSCGGGLVAKSNIQQGVLESPEYQELSEPTVPVNPTGGDSTDVPNEMPVLYEPTLAALGSLGEVYYYLGGSNGVILCFHGTNGNAGGWSKTDKKLFLDQMRSMNLSFICPTSLDRLNKQWNTTNTSDNADIRNVESILNLLKVPTSTPIYLVGHSNGGGFVSRFALFSARAKSVRAAQYSNSSGIQRILSEPSYQVPSLFNFSDCDQVVDATKVRESVTILANKQPSVRHYLNDLDDHYAAGTYSHCHEFVSTAPMTAKFFFENNNPQVNAPLKVAFFQSSAPADQNTSARKNEGDGVAIDSEANVILGGCFSGKRVIGDQTLTAQGDQDAFVIKYSPTGQKLWLRQFSAKSSGVEDIFDLAVDSSGFIYINGSFTHAMNLGGTILVPNGPSDHFLAKLHPLDGSIVWAKRFGGAGADGGNEIAIIDDTHLAVSAMSSGGYSYTDANGMIRNFKTTNKDGFYLRVSTADGSVNLVRQFGGSGDQQIRAIAASPNGQILVGLEYDGTAVFQSTTESAKPSGSVGFRTNQDGVFYYLDSRGNLIWHRKISSPGYDNFRAAGFDQHGDIFVSGVFSDGALLSRSGGITLYADKSYEQFVAKYSADGTLQWFRRFGGGDETRSQRGGEIEIADNGVAYVTFGFRNRVELFDQNGISTGAPLIVNHPRDVAGLLAFSSSGNIIHSSYTKGTHAPADNELAGNVASSVIATRTIGSRIYIAKGSVLEGTGEVHLSGQNTPYAGSTTTREFSITLFVEE